MVMVSVSEQELASFKAAQQAAAPAVKTWRLIHFTTAQDAVNFANVAPAQQAGEFGMTDNPAGGVDGYYFF